MRTPRAQFVGRRSIAMGARADYLFAGRTQTFSSHVRSCAQYISFFDGDTEAQGQTLLDCKANLSAPP
jgi:hypothetical protein